jgi:L,D-peptidoglycan transpeptidase YkuD (ErfK/YbiS/YcfS/YnhG family)
MSSEPIITVAEDDATPAGVVVMDTVTFNLPRMPKGTVLEMRATYPGGREQMVWLGTLDHFEMT